MTLKLQSFVRASQLRYRTSTINSFLEVSPVFLSQQLQLANNHNEIMNVFANYETALSYRISCQWSHLSILVADAMLRRHAVPVNQLKII